MLSIRVCLDPDPGSRSEKYRIRIRYQIRNFGSVSSPLNNSNCACAVLSALVLIQVRIVCSTRRSRSRASWASASARRSRARPLWPRFSSPTTYSPRTTRWVLQLLFFECTCRILKQSYSYCSVLLNERTVLKLVLVRMIRAYTRTVHSIWVSIYFTCALAIVCLCVTFDVQVDAQ